MFSLQKIMFKLLVILFIAKYVTASFNYYQLSKICGKCFVFDKSSKEFRVGIKKKIIFCEKKKQITVLYIVRIAQAQSQYNHNKCLGFYGLKNNQRYVFL